MALPVVFVRDARWRQAPRLSLGNGLLRPIMSHSSGWLGSWARAGVQRSRKIRTIRIITVGRLPYPKGYAFCAAAAPFFRTWFSESTATAHLVISGWGRAVTVQANLIDGKRDPLEHRSRIGGRSSHIFVCVGGLSCAGRSRPADSARQRGLSKPG